MGTGVIFDGAWLCGRMSETPSRRTHPIRRCGVVPPSQSTQYLHFCTPGAALGPAAFLLPTAQGASPPCFRVDCNFVECTSCHDSFDDGVDNSAVQQTACDRCLEGSSLVSRSCVILLRFRSPWFWRSCTRCCMDLSHDSNSTCLRSFSLLPQRVSPLWTT